ncbi:MAG: DNA polymerase III subunit delta [Candidatus Pacebacteria bacterium]|nr:DNA polymerase III subunit delta [Candidatus Paceibacterota bacterium]
MIFFLFGSDTYRSHLKLKEIKEQFLKSVSEGYSAILDIDGEKANLEAINEKSASSSLFSSKRLLVIDNILQNKNQQFLSQALDYFIKTEKNESTNVFVFLENENLKISSLSKEAKALLSFLKKQKFVQEFKPLDNKQLITFIAKEFKKYNKEVEVPAAQFLVTHSGNDLWKLSKQIHKIAHYSENKKITEADIENNIPIKIEENIFILTDKLGQKQPSQGLKELELQLASGLAAEYVLAIFRKHLQKLFQVKEVLAEGITEKDIAQKFSWHPYATKKLVMQSNNFSLEEIDHQISELNKIDFLSKTGKLETEEGLRLFMSFKDISDRQ